MGANASKEASPAPTSATSALHRLNEKVPTPTKTRQSSSLHHSADRLHRIEAEAHAALASDSSSSSAQQEHTRNPRPQPRPTRRSIFPAVKSWSKSAWELPHLPSRQHGSSTTPTLAASLHSRQARPRSPSSTSSTPASRDEGRADRESSSPPVGAGLFALTNCIRLEVVKKFELDRL